MIYKLLSYPAIVFSSAISDGLAGSVSGPIRLSLSVEDVGSLGAFLGAFVAITGCKFALERSEAKERNRELILALEGRLMRPSRNADPAAPGA